MKSTEKSWQTYHDSIDRVALKATLLRYGRRLSMQTATKIQFINKAQIKIIYTLGQSLGIVDRSSEWDSLHEMVEHMTGKVHISELTSNEAIKIIDRLKENMKGSTRVQKSKNDQPDIPGMASKAQIKMIWRLMYQLKSYDTEPSKSSLNDRLRGFLKKYGGIDDMRFLTAAQAWRVIEGLKGAVKSAENKKGGEKA
jgi:hypothetical protein